MNRKLFKHLTPRTAWNYFVPYSTVEEFISDFYNDDRYNLSATDYKSMCQLFVKDFPVCYEQVFLQEDLDFIADLLEQHIRDYIEKIGGEKNLRLLTEEEMEDIFAADVAELFKSLKEWFYLIT